MKCIPSGVAARCQRIKNCPINGLNQGLQVLLNDAMKLERLPGCEFEMPTAVLVRNAVQRKPLCGRTYTTREAHTYHKRIRRLDTLGHTFVANVAVVLLVDTMEPR